MLKIFPKFSPPIELTAPADQNKWDWKTPGEKLRVLESGDLALANGHEEPEHRSLNMKQPRKISYHPRHPADSVEASSVQSYAKISLFPADKSGSVFCRK